MNILFAIFFLTFLEDIKCIIYGSEFVFLKIICKFAVPIFLFFKRQKLGVSIWLYWRSLFIINGVCFCLMFC